MKSSVLSKTSLRLALFGLAAGFCNGLLGAGGGILIVFGLTPLLARDPNGKRDVFANALAVMLPVTTVSVITYLVAGRFDAAGFGIFSIPAALGGIVGGILLDRLSLHRLNRVFALIVIWSGIYLIMR